VPTLKRILRSDGNHCPQAGNEPALLPRSHIFLMTLPALARPRHVYTLSLLSLLRMILKDQSRWNMAVAGLTAIRSQRRDLVTQENVDEYNELVGTFEDATGESLAQFYIPPSAMKHRHVGSLPTSSRAPKRQYSELQYCDDTIYQQRVHRLWNYVQRVELTRV
jgi:hypothetical protein